jgi:DUF2945 family protein
MFPGNRSLVLSGTRLQTERSQHPVATDGCGGMAMSERSFRKGDQVSWTSHGQTVKGTVQQKITDDTHAAGRAVRASKKDPQYRVTSNNTGADAVHKPEALRPDKQ